MDFVEIEAQYGLGVYPKRNLVIVSGKGAVVTDAQGKEYIDCMAGHGVANVGHSNEQVVQSITRQAQRLITCPGTLYNDVRARLLQKLVAIGPRDLQRVFLCNSGSEAIEAAIKLARFHSGKPNFICAMRGFHGRTLGALSATFNKHYKRDFLPLVPGFDFVPFNNFAKLQARVNEKTAGIILEIVQGEGGVNLGKKDYFTAVGKLCRDNDILLLIDEVQTGFCRTGRMFAYEHFAVQPDLLCAAKAMAGGVPMGAVWCPEKLQPPTGKHGSTFGGNPLACAAALAAIDFMCQQQLARQSAQKGAYLLDKLRKIASPKIREVRGLGLMIGIECKEKVKPYILDLIDEGVLALPAGSTVIRLLPPLIIEYRQLDIVVQNIAKVLG